MMAVTLLLTGVLVLVLPCHQVCPGDRLRPLGPLATSVAPRPPGLARAARLVQAVVERDMPRVELGAAARERGDCREETPRSTDPPISDLDLGNMVQVGRGEVR